jgi:hypothetical protein
MTFYLLNVRDTGVRIKVFITEPFSEKMYMAVMTEDEIYTRGKLIKILDCRLSLVLDSTTRNVQKDSSISC